ncbi:putative serine/threonine-protein kinase [Nocardioides phosphati]|uniref:non-specific serine/threonine protein kinase n=1 Tax=Nocardioides phosphati TaxID=1867775 RepID=A0ABQ2N9G6_9ACTN|nr:Stk1 family PASTA domain-containing Ser/Thr kinase [Nocardioides phosphati]GGO88343.1 putative serine/threonine-protein kinase [Nocardioides phosphati]
MTNQAGVVGGRYELGELLGRGGMAEVRKGTDTRLGRVVAVKRLRTDLAGDPTFQHRFRREAQSSASLNHPAIVAVYDTGEEPGDDGVPQPYIVMEYVAGRTLRDILREGRKILPERALEITSGVLSALDYSHRAGIIHRDIKPANVMLTPAGDVKVMDFGIARAISDASSTMTQTAAVVGTAQYLSPEQARGESVDSRSDVYSTGCLLYELLTGRPPFVGDSPVAVAYQHVREPAQPPSTFDPDIPPELDAIVMKALTKRVEDRYQSAAAMRADIERYLAGHAVQAPPVAAVAPTAVVAAAPAPYAATTGSHTAVGLPVVTEEEPRRRRAWWFWGLLLVLLVFLIAWGLPQLMKDDAPQQAKVPGVVKLMQAAAERTLRADGFEPEVTTAASRAVARGRVISQDPTAGTLFDLGGTVHLVVSAGPPTATVPDVTGRPVDEARQVLKAAGFDVVTKVRQSDEPKDQVVDQDPVGGQTVVEGRTVTLYLSDGRERIPNVIGKKQGRACDLIRERGFQCEVKQFSATTEPKGTVVDQLPGAEEADEGTVVTIYVSTYVEPTPTPSPTATATTNPTATPDPGTTTNGSIFPLP